MERPRRLRRDPVADLRDAAELCRPLRILRSLKKPEILDLALIAVDEEYMNRGVSTVFSAGLLNILKNGTVKYAETNLNLEDNYAIINQWRRFRAVNHKRRRSYVKKIGTEN